MATKVKDRTIHKWIENIPELTYRDGDSKIFCETCKITLVLKKYSVKKHLASRMHKQQEYSDTSITFYEDFINFLVLVNIPWSKVNNPHFKYFFNKYICCTCTNARLLDESSLRKRYLDLVFKKKMDYIHQEIGEDHVGISVDEFTDVGGKNIVNILIRSLKERVSSHFFLLASMIMDDANGQTIAQFVTDELKKFWTDTFETSSKKVLLLSSTGVDYMLEAGNVLKGVFPNMLHVICVANILHSVAEQIKNEYSNVDSLISTVKKIFPRKKPEKVRILKQMYPKMPLPPKTDANRLATWIEAASYYQKYFNEITNVLNHHHNPNNREVGNALQILKNTNVEHDLNYICQNYGIIKSAVDELQSADLTLDKSFGILDEVCKKLNKYGSEAVKFKFEIALDQSPNYNDIKMINEKINQSKEELTLEQYYKFASLTSVDIEQSFSDLKWIFLAQNKGNCKNNKLTKLLFIHFNNQVMREKELELLKQQKNAETSTESLLRPKKRSHIPIRDHNSPIEHSSNLDDMVDKKSTIICLDDDFDDICMNPTKHLIKESTICLDDDFDDICMNPTKHFK